MKLFTESRLRSITALIVRRMGSDATETEIVADHLVRANLAGHDSHGVGMLPAYIRLLHDGLLVPNQTPETVLDFGALLVIDARRGYGQRMTTMSVAPRDRAGAARPGPACWRCATRPISAASAPMGSRRWRRGWRSSAT